MADSNRDINLRIRAKDYSQKTFKQLKKSMDELVESQKDQQAAADRGESSARELERSYQDLERATKAMVRQAADIKAFENQRAALQEARDATKNAQDAVDSYSKKISSKTKVTAEENKELRNLRREMQAAEKNELRQVDRYEKLEARLNSYGVSTRDTKAALTAISNEVSKSNESLQRQEAAVKANESALRKMAEAEKEASANELAANIERQRKALDALAKDAISAANGWRTAAVSTKEYGDAATPVSAAMNRLMGVTSPAGKTLGQLGAEMNKLTNEAKDSNGPIDGLKNKIKQLEDAQKQIARNAGLVDLFQRQMEAVKSSREAYSKAQADVRNYASQLAGAGDGAKDIQSKLSAAQQVLAKATKGFRDSADAAQETRAQMRSLGIDTKSTASAQDQLVNSANQVIAAEKALGNAIQRSGSQEASSQAESLELVGSSASKAAVGMGTLTSASTPLAESINAIVNPAARANSTLSKMEDNAELMSAAFSSIRKPVEDATRKFNALAQTQNAIKNTAGLVDTFRRQTKAVADARKSYQDARANLAELVAQLRSGAPVTDEMRSKMAGASKAITDAAESFRKQADEARQTQSALRAAGVDTNNLAAAEERLTKAAHDSSNAEKSLSNAVSEYGKKSKMAHEQSSLGAKTAMSALSNLKGEVLGLAAAYGSLQGVLGEVNAVIDASNSRQKFMSQVSLAVGKDVKAQAQEWEFVNKLSTQWGLNMQDTAKSYAKFAVTVKESGYSMKDAKALFENISIYAKANNLSQEEIERVFYAVDQMLSQGQMTTSELKQQLGNVLPGIFESAAIRLNGTTQNFQKQLSAGVFGVEGVFELFKQLAGEATESANTAAGGLISAQQRLKNAKTDFDLKIADSGFIDEYTKLIEKMTAILSSDKAGKAAEALGSAFNGAAEAAEFLIDHIDAVIDILKGLATLMVAKSIIGFAGVIKGAATSVWTLGKEMKAILGSMGAVTGGLGTMATATTILGKAFKFLGKAIPFIGWGIMIADVLSSLWDMSSSVRDVGWSIMKTFKTAFDYVSNLITGHYKSWQETADENEKWALEHRSQEDKDRIQGKKDGASSKASGGRVSEQSDIGFTQLDKRANALKKETEKLDKDIAEQSKSIAKKSAKQDLEERLKLIRTEYEPRLKEAMEVAGTKAGFPLYKKIKAQQDEALAIEKKKWQMEVGDKQAEAAKKRAEKIQELQAAIKAKGDSVDNRDNTLNSSPDNYGAREQKAVDAALDKYKDLEAQSRKLGGAENERFQSEINGLKQTEEAMVRQKYALAEIERYNKQIKSLEDARNAQISALKAQYDAHQLSETDYISKTNEVYDATKQKILDAAQAAREFGNAHKEAFSNDAEFQKFQSKNDEYQTKIKTSGDQLTSYQKQAAQGLAGSVNEGFNALVTNITAATQGTQSWGEAFQATAASMLQYFAQLLQQIAMTIIQAAIMDALLGGAPAASGGAMSQANPTNMLGAFASVGKNHKGGMAGSSGVGKMRVPMSMFANANRYHTGGMVGLQPDEVPIVAQKGEEVLTRDDPRNRLNGMGGNGSSGDTKIVAVDDQRSAVTEALKTPEGTNAMIVTMRQNLSTIKKMLK